MARDDEWGRDPSVQMMRGVFKGMEKAQEVFLSRLGVRSLDPRLRRWRERALIAFEGSRGRAVKGGMGMDPQVAAGLYIHCLAKIIRSDGLDVPQNALPEEGINEAFLKEVLG